MTDDQLRAECESTGIDYDDVRGFLQGLHDEFQAIAPTLTEEQIGLLMNVALKRVGRIKKV